MHSHTFFLAISLSRVCSLYLSLSFIMLLSAFGIALEFEVNVALNETMDDENDVRTSWVIYKKIRKQYFIYWDASIIYVIQNSIKM